MTGFGRGDVRKNGCHIYIEIKSLNHRYLDISLKLPKQLISLEESIRSTIANYIKRGRVELNITFDIYENGLVNLEINKDLLQQYFDILKYIKSSLNITDNIRLSDILLLPDIINADSKNFDLENAWDVLEEALLESLNNLIDMRVEEGIKLKNDIEMRLDNLKSLIESIEKRSPYVLDEYRNKLLKKINELTNGDFDQSRFLTEVALMAEKSSIDEEITRFKSHISQFKLSLDSEMPIGKKLDFITQEMNREVNTIGSKSIDIDITNNVIELKDQIEKIREQVQNIE